MDDGFYVLMGLFTVIVAPIWIIFHYMAQMRSRRGLTAQDERLLADLWQIAQKIEARQSNLESVLDHDAPGWRRKVAEDRAAHDVNLAAMEKK